MKSENVLITGGSGFIGTNLVEHFLSAGANVVNIDLAAPRNPAHMAFWRSVDLTDRAAVDGVFRAFSPSLVLHAGARTDLFGTSIADYPANVAGTRNIAEAAATTPSVRRVVAFSSMLVCKLGYQSTYDEDYCPDTAYGQSKVEGEKLLRKMVAPFEWTILRPTSIWGPWFGAPYRSFFEAVRMGYYMHPIGHRSIRNYGYVKNSVAQIAAIVAAEKSVVDRQTFYIGDYDPIDVKDWADYIASQYGRGPVHGMPMPFFTLAAKTGDALKALGWNSPPLTTRRIRNLLTPAIYDLSKTRAICPVLAYDMKSGARETIEWLSVKRPTR